MKLRVYTRRALVESICETFGSRVDEDALADQMEDRIIDLLDVVLDGAKSITLHDDGEGND